MSYRKHLGVVAAALLTIAMALPALAQQATDYLGIPGPIAFDGADYALVWSSQPTPEYTKHEYLPAGQTVDAYDSMLMVDFLVADITPMQMAQEMADRIEALKATDPVVNWAMIENKASGEVVLDFVLSGKDPAGATIIEWNAYRYASATNAEGQAGSLLFAISRRAYGDAAAKEFLKSLGDLKAEQVQALATAPMPVITN